MTHFLYVHKDARQARALSTWVAMAKAIGRDEARALFASAEPLVWGPSRTPPPPIPGTVRQSLKR